ncbi:uncharacterized protein LOC124362943 [Homalodisca vitripennis]|uniref:uncharacterized protein LOC124362943 n=1 Tax=Homalodisca vitripennis TaxID=197043 RepID=UPI001EEC7ECE|nr:uncharacterized protein LOC124362943 [Homalodisca vitripennis]
MKLDKTNKLNSQRNKNLQVQPLTERRNTQTAAGSSRNLSRQLAVGSPPRNKRPVQGQVRQPCGDTPDTGTTVDSVPRGYRSQGSQTLNSKQLETMYYDGVIRYPSARLEEAANKGSAPSSGVAVKEMGLQTEVPLEVLHHPPPPDIGLTWDEDRDEDSMGGAKDFVKINATIPEPYRMKTADSSKMDPTRAPPTYQRGVVPRYLREHRKEQEKERMVRAKEAADECPEGHIMLPEDVKLKHLNTLKQNYAELVSQLNQLPVSTDTLRTHEHARNR